MRILKRVEELRGEGRDVVSLCAGEPSGGAPASVQRRAAELHAKSAEFSYTPSLGIWQLREAIAGHYKRWYDLEDRKSTRLNSSHVATSCAVFCSQKKTIIE